MLTNFSIIILWICLVKYGSGIIMKIYPLHWNVFYRHESSWNHTCFIFISNVKASANLTGVIIAGSCFDNECEYDNGQCSQYCVDTFDSYYCSCEEGYRLAPVDYSCPCKHYKTFINQTHCRHIVEHSLTLQLEEFKINIISTNLLR